MGADLGGVSIAGTNPIARGAPAVMLGGQGSAEAKSGNQVTKHTFALQL